MNLERYTDKNIHLIDPFTLVDIYKLREEWDSITKCQGLDRVTSEKTVVKRGRERADRTQSVEQ